MSFHHVNAIKKQMQGFTLIEVLMTIAILSVLTGLAAPSIQDFFIKNTFRKISDDFISSVFKAKNIAVSKNTCTMMCMSSTLSNNIPTCATSGSDWQSGWIVFLNTSCDSSVNKPPSAEDVLEVRSGDSSEYFLQSQNSTKKIQFNPRGANGLGSSDEFDLTYKAVNNAFNAKFGMNICLDVLGRTRTIPSDKTCKGY